jgi:hypothetical protein
MSNPNFKTFHFDFSQFEDHRTGSLTKEPLFLKVQSSKIPIKMHTVQTRGAARGLNKAVDALLTGGREESLTHFVEIPEDLLPEDRLALMMVVGPDRGKPRSNLPDLYHVRFHVPERITRWYAERTFRKLGRNLVHPKLARLEKHAPKDLQSAIDEFVNAEQIVGPWDTAISILIQDPDLANSEPHVHEIVKNDHVAPSEGLDKKQYNRVYDLSLQISKQGPAKPNSGFARIRQSAEPDGTKMSAEYTWEDKDGVPIYEAGDPVMIYDLSDTTASWSAEPASYATRSARTDTRLKSQTWSVDQGQAVDNKIVKESDALELLARTSAAAAGTSWTVTNATPHHGLNVYAESLNYEPAQYELSIDVKNTYLRVLGSFVQFFSDVEMTKPIDNPKVPNFPSGWPIYFPKALAEKFETPSKKAIGTVTNVNTIMGIPMPTDPTKIKVPWPQEAQAAQLLFGCAGTSRWDNNIVWPGFIITGIFQYGIPLLFMAIGAAVTDTQWYKAFVSNTEKVIAACAVAFGPVSAGVAVGAALGNTKSVLFSFAGIIVGLLVKKGMEQLAIYITARLIAAQVQNAVPIVGWGFRVAAVALNFAQIAVTTGEILSSPAVLQIDIKREMTLDFTLKPDPKHGEPDDPKTAIWPAVAYNAVVTVNYENGTSYQSEQELPPTSSSEPLRFAFSPVGWGGKLQITANVFSKNGWLCGKYQSDLMVAVPDNASIGIMKREGSIVEQLMPLTLDTQYDYKQQVFYTEQQQHHWVTGTVPTATQSALSCSNVGNNFCKPVNLTIHQQAFQIGYAFQASGQNLPLEDPKGPIDQGQMFTMQNISVLSSEQMQKRLKFPEFGFKVQPNIAYNTWGEGATKETINNDNFVLDSRNGEYHLRQVMLMDGKPNFDLETSNRKSWGKFYIPHLDALVIHPSRLVIAVSWEFSKIQILQLPDAPMDDKDAPEAQIVSGEGLLEGLTHGPIAIAISPDGRIMLLESLNKRIQAFDTKGNPVPSFTGRLLMTLPAAPYIAELDARKFPEALKDQFRQHGLTLIADLAPATEPMLEAAKLTKEVVSAFADEGIYLTYNINEEGHIVPEGSSFITVVTAGQAWRVTDPNKNAIYDVIKKGALQVFVVLNNTIVEIIGKQQRWVIRDLTGANSYLAYADPANPTNLNIYEYLAYMPLREPEGMTYVDMAMEAKGYIYVLSHKDTGGVVKNTDYALDIYNPDGSFLVRTPDPKLHPGGNMQYVSAARIALDVWRNLFTLNYSTFKGPGGRTEPSVSQWMPTPPLFDLDKTTANFNLFKNGDMAKIRVVFAERKITLSSAATIQTISADGHWSIVDGQKTFDTMASVDKIYVYGISA